VEAEQRHIEEAAQLQMEIKNLMKQLQAAETENLELKATKAELQNRESDLQAIVHGRQARDQLVPHSVHQQVCLENKILKAQIRQLRADLEVLYIDEHFITGAAGADHQVGNGGGAQSQMSTVTRLGALLGYSDNRSNAQVRRQSVASRDVHWRPSLFTQALVRVRL
jgi:dynactin complex subunit